MSPRDWMRKRKKATSTKTLRFVPSSHHSLTFKLTWTFSRPSRHNKYPPIQQEEEEEAGDYQGDGGEEDEDEDDHHEGDGNPVSEWLSAVICPFKVSNSCRLLRDPIWLLSYSLVGYVH